MKASYPSALPLRWIYITLSYGASYLITIDELCVSSFKTGHSNVDENHAFVLLPLDMNSACVLLHF